MPDCKACTVFAGVFETISMSTADARDRPLHTIVRSSALLFALTLQPVLERVDTACEEAPLVSYLDDMSIVGKLTPAAGAFRRLCVDDDGVRSIGLEPRPPKCGIYGGAKEQVAAEATKLRIAHKLDGFTAVGTPLGSAEYIPTPWGGVQRRWRR